MCVEYDEKNPVHRFMMIPLNEPTVHFTWDYEDSLTKYYHIYPCSEEGEKIGEDSICLNVSQSEFNDNIIQEIVGNMNLLVLMNSNREGD